MDTETAIKIAEPTEASPSLDDTPEPDEEEEPTSDSDGDDEETGIDAGAGEQEEETDDGLIEAAGYDTL
jgi:hypothetical protein